MTMFPYIGAAAVRHELTLAFNAKRLVWGKRTTIAVYETKSCRISDVYGHLCTGSGVVFQASERCGFTTCDRNIR